MLFQKGHSLNKGKKLSFEHREKLKIARLRIPARNKGKHWKLSEEIKKKWKELRSDPTKHYNWKGGISKDKNYKKEKIKKWREKNYNRVLFLNERRRSRKLNASGYHTLGELENLKAQYNWICPSCKKKEPEIKLTEDHIIPLSKGGSDNIENIQPLCRSCNAKKYTKIIKYDQF